MERKNLDLANIKNYIILSLVFIIAAMLIRFAGYILFQNYALYIESIHMLMDVIITILVIIVIYFVRSPINKKYPYGLYKIEDLTAILISIMIFVMTLDFAKSMFSAVPNLSIYTSVFEFVSLIPLFLSGYVKFIAGKKINSPSLHSDSFHVITDVLEGSIVGIGLYLAAILHSEIYYYIALIVAILALFIIAIDIFKDSVYSILDLPKNKKLNLQITKILSGFKEIYNTKSIKVRWAGPVTFFELVLEFNPQLTIEDAHSITDRIENKLYEDFPSLESVSIHIEPNIRNNFKIGVPLDNNEPPYIISDNFTKAPFFAKVIVENRKIKNMEIEKNIFFESNKNLAGAEFMEYLAEHEYTDVIIINIGEITFSILLRHNIKVWQAASQDLSGNLDLFLNFSLKKLDAPTVEASWRKNML
ncbi:MAG: cation diffusion facilitator family transporter [Thermoplasmata archaeon]